MKNAFTLIELLVVVLIIGILAAVALPQYEKAVEKSRSAEALILLKHLHEAGKLYLMSNPGAHNVSFEDLGVELPADYTLAEEMAEGEVYCNKHWCVMTLSDAFGSFPSSKPDSPVILRCDGWKDGDIVNSLYGLEYAADKIWCINSDKWCQYLFGTSKNGVVNL